MENIASLKHCIVKKTEHRPIVKGTLIVKATLLHDSLNKVKSILHPSLLHLVLAVVFELFHMLPVLLQNRQLLDLGRSKAAPE